MYKGGVTATRRQNQSEAKKIRSEQGRVAIPAPSKSLTRFESAATLDLGMARLTIGLFGAILGLEQQGLFPGYRGGLLELRNFPTKLQKDARALVDWATAGSPVELNSIYAARARIERATHQMRSHSNLGKHFLRRANRLRRLHPPVQKARWGPPGVVFHLILEENGKPLTERIVLLCKAFKPSILQIVPHCAYLNYTWMAGALTIRLDEDGYSVKDITLALDTPKQITDSSLRRFEGELIDFFETGTEGVIWALEDERHNGYEALQTICEGDHLTILDWVGEIVWRGFIRCDKKIGFRPYPMNPECGQQCALGHWVHWIQRGFKPDAWARFFIRPDYDRFRGILVRKVGSKTDSRLGPESN